MAIDPALAPAAQALNNGDLAKAETLLRHTLRQDPENPEALNLLARIAVVTGFTADAEQLLRKAVAIQPTSVEAHAALASLLCRLERADEALELLDRAIARFPRVIWPLSLKLAALDAERRTEEALPLHEALVSLARHEAVPWINYGHALRAVGRTGDAITAYRNALEIDPGNGLAWWGLAGLRTAPFDAEDIARMEQALAEAGAPLHAAQLHFALGRAFADHGHFERSFRHYEAGNQVRGQLNSYDPNVISDLVRDVRARFDSEFLAQREGCGCDARDPIFIVGMPRSGSTLVEQILASHPLVEGSGELFELHNLAARLAPANSRQNVWPELVAKLGAEDLSQLGQSYLASVRRHRRTNRPFFTDKMPANWRYVGLIHLILPNARIIDVRRHPVACCLSAFSTYFNRETSFPVTLKELGLYYADYVRMISHFEDVLPGRIHRIQYEELVNDLEGEVRILLGFLGLPFDPDCLRFNATSRAVHTSSAQQVREPINGKGIGFWRNYEPWLGALKMIGGNDKV